MRALLVILLLCPMSQPAAAKSAFLIGPWGGAHVGVTFEGGLAEVQFDCASGSIDVPVYPAKKTGDFEAKGTFRAGAPGPIRVGQIFRSQRATYSGQVGKDSMTLSVTLEDGTVVGPFTLVQGAKPQLMRCL